MRRSAPVVLLALAAILAAAGTSCDSERRAISRDDLPDLEAPEVSVVVDEDGFTPDTVTVESGDLVRLRNTGAREHSFTADAFDTGILLPGEETLVSLTTPGSVTVTDRAGSGAGATMTVEVVDTDDPPG